MSHILLLVENHVFQVRALTVLKESVVGVEVVRNLFGLCSLQSGVVIARKIARWSLVDAELALPYSLLVVVVVVEILVVEVILAGS